jgi:hypothetical protein
VNTAQLGSDLARESSLYGKVLFVVATPETGAESLLPALELLPGLTTTPVPTNLFSEGIGSLLGTWTERIRPAFGDLADDQRFLRDVRLLADTPLVARLTAAGADWVVEYSPDHLSAIGSLLAVYPDAQFLHLVRDGRQVAASLSSPLLSWPPWLAARRWCDDQRGALALGEGPNVHVLAMEVLLGDPLLCIGELVKRVGIEAPGEAVEQAAAALGGGRRPMPDVPVGRVATLIDVLGRDLLEIYGYETQEVSPLRRLAARLELGTPGEIAWAARSALGRARHAGREP